MQPRICVPGMHDLARACVDHHRGVGRRAGRRQRDDDEDEDCEDDQTGSVRPHET